jgi:hypothetical protein
MLCPRCGFNNSSTEECFVCGFNLEKRIVEESTHAQGIVEEFTTVQGIKTPRDCDREKGVRLDEQRVVVTDFDMPFGSMVKLMVKWAVASIPAAIILVILGTIAFGIIKGLLFHV